MACDLYPSPPRRARAPPRETPPHGHDPHPAAGCFREMAPRRLASAGPGLRRGLAAGLLPARALRWGAVRLPRRGAILLPALPPRAAGVAGGALAALGPRAERRAAAAGQPDG